MNEYLKKSNDVIYSKTVAYFISLSVWNSNKKEVNKSAHAVWTLYMYVYSAVNYRLFNLCFIKNRYFPNCL